MSKNQKTLLGNKTFFLSTLIFSDIIALVSAFFVAYTARNFGPFRLFLDIVQPIGVYLQVLPLVLILLIIIFSIIGLYEPKVRRTQTSEMYSLLKAVTVWILLIMSASYLSKYDYSRIVVLLFYFLTVVFTILGRLTVRNLQKKLAGYGFGKINIAVIGSGKEAQKIAKRIKNYREAGFNFVGFINNKLGSFVIGHVSQLPRIIKKYKIDEVYIADFKLTDRKILDLITKCSKTSAKFKIISNIFELVAGSFDIAALDSIPSLDLSKVSLPWWKSVYKRIFDVFFATLSFIVTIPLWTLIIVAIKISSKGSAILIQKRVGKDGRVFNMYKFRTLEQGSPLYESAPTYKDDARVTRIGKILRRTSLDELPQLINVIKAEMSLVGPRPEMPFVVKKYNEWEKRRLTVKPGLTGLWQILGRKELPLSENLEYDFYYINNQSLILDIVIILKTIPVIISGRGAY